MLIHAPSQVLRCIRQATWIKQFIPCTLTHKITDHETHTIPGTLVKTIKKKQMQTEKNKPIST